MDMIQENYNFNIIAKENNTLKSRLFYNYRLSVLLYNHSRYLCKFRYVVLWYLAFLGARTKSFKNMKKEGTFGGQETGLSESTNNSRLSTNNIFFLFIKIVNFLKLSNQ